jgi:hypothetical protein
MAFRGTGMANWNTSNVQDIAYLVKKCINFAEDLSVWNVSNVTGSMYQAFFGTAIDYDFSAWQYAPTNDITGCFQNCVNLGKTSDPHIRLWIQNMPNIKNTNYLLAFCTNYNENFDNLNDNNAFNKIESCNEMFNGCTSWNNGDVPRGSDKPISWDFSNVNEMKAMFYNVWEFNQDLNINLANLQIANNLFYNARNFARDLSGWRAPKLQYTIGMFRNAQEFNSNLDDLFDGKDNELFPLLETELMFFGAYKFNNGEAPNVGGTGLSTWPMDKVSALRYMFWAARAFNQDISPWVLKEITSMDYVFGASCNFNFGQAQGVGKYAGITYANGSNDPFANWDLSKVTSWNQTFQNNTWFNANMDSVLGSVEKTENVQTIRAAFDNAIYFNNGADPNNPEDYRYPLNWVFRNLENISYTFRRAIRFRQSIRGFNAPKLLSMEQAFYDNKQYEDRIGDIQYWPSIAFVFNMANMCNGDNFNEQMEIPTEHLDAIYLAWGAFADRDLVQTEVSVHWGRSTYSALSADARAKLDRNSTVPNAGWFIEGDSPEEP